jgi:hypothetical protein
MRQTNGAVGDLRLRASLLSVVAFLLADTVGAQGAPGTRLTVDVQVSSVGTSNGVTSVTYRLISSATSQEQVFLFVVDAPTSGVNVVMPSPESDWTVASEFGTRSAFVWSVLGEQLMPGTSGPLLKASANGLPALVSYWISGYVPPAPLSTTDQGVVPPVDVLATHSRTGTTIGVVPMPAGTTPQSLTLRLKSYLDVLCAPGGVIANASTCTSFQSKLTQAAKAIVAHDNNAASLILGAFQNELKAQRGKSVSETVYWLLVSNAELILDSL